MYRKLPRSTDNILGYEISGPLMPAEAAAITQDVARAMAAQGSPRMLVDLRSFPYATPGALWDDLKFAPSLERLERIVLIGEAEWEARATAAINAVCRGECRFFSRREVDEAWDWITRESSRLPTGLGGYPTSTPVGH